MRLPLLRTLRNLFPNYWNVMAGRFYCPALFFAREGFVEVAAPNRKNHRGIFKFIIVVLVVVIRKGEDEDDHEDGGSPVVSPHENGVLPRPQCWLGFSAA